MSLEYTHQSAGYHTLYMKCFNALCCCAWVHIYTDVLPSSWGFSQRDIKSLDSVLWHIPIHAIQVHFKAVHIEFCSILDCHLVLFLAAGRSSN